LVEYKVQIGNAILDATAFGRSKIIKNIFLSYLEGYTPGDKDEDFDNQIEKLEVVNRGTSYEDNVRPVLELLDEELERLETKDIGKTSIKFDKKKFAFDSSEDEEGKSFAIDTDQFDFSLRDLTDDSKINQILGFGEYTREFEDLTSVKDITREINERLDRSFPTLFNYVQENLVVKKEGESTVLYFDDGDFTMNVLREFSPSRLSFKREKGGSKSAEFSSYLRLVELEEKVSDFRDTPTELVKEIQKSWRNQFYELSIEGKRNEIPIARLKDIKEGSREAAELFIKTIFNGDRAIKIFNDAYNVSNEIVDVKLTFPNEILCDPEGETEGAQAFASSATVLDAPIMVERITSGTMTWTSTDRPGMEGYIRDIDPYDRGARVDGERVKVMGELPPYFPQGMTRGDSEKVIDVLEDFLYSTVANYLELKEAIEEALAKLPDTTEEE